MPTSKPRIAVTVSPHVYETISRLAFLQGKSRGAVVGEMLEIAHPPLMRTIALIEAAMEAPGEVHRRLHDVFEDMGLEAAKTLGGGLGQLDFLLLQRGGEGASQSALDPRSSNTGVRSPGTRIPEPNTVFRKSRTKYARKGRKNG